MREKINLLGKNFSSLKVIRDAGYSLSGSAVWECVCDCGKKTNVKSVNLRKGYTKSCGCLKFEAKKTHGLGKTRLNRIWHGIKDRCLNSKSKYYKNYGGRGITICKEWLDFMNFYNWAIANGYDDSLTIDRINNNANYEPNNCRWVDIKTQANNRRNNTLITINGETLNIQQWAEKLNITRNEVNKIMKEEKKWKK